MKKEDIEFLLKYGNELKTQDNLSTAKPVYWGIKDRKKNFGNDINDPDGIQIVEDGENIDAECICDYFEENDIDILFTEDIKNDEELLECENKWDIEIFLALNRIADKYRVYEYQYEDFIETNLLFLTKTAADLYLKNNSYHHTDYAHTYCMHAWRNEKLKKFLNIIENLEENDFRIEVGY
jgi:hypothetical protein